MKPLELIKQLQSFNQSKSILAQVVGVNSGAWNMYFDFKEVESFIILTLSYPDLIEMPMIKSCDQGHRFPIFQDHPVYDGRICCPHCLANDNNNLRKKLGIIS